MFGILQELAALFSLWGGCPALAWTWLAVEAGVSPCCARALPCPAFPKACAAWILTPKPFGLPWTDLDLQGLAFSQCHLTLQEAWCEEVPCLCLGQGNSAFLLCHLWFLWTLQTFSLAGGVTRLWARRQDSESRWGLVVTVCSVERGL